MTPNSWRPVPEGHPLRARCAKIADRLPGYRLGSRRGSLHFSGPGQSAVLIGATNDLKRLVLRGVYPIPEPRPSYWRSGTGITISVAITRSDSAIAADITRRLLPTYLTELNDAHERIHRYEHGVAARQQVIEATLARLPGAWLAGPCPPRGSLIRASRWDSPHVRTVDVLPSQDGTTADITITGASRQLLAEILDTLPRS